MLQPLSRRRLPQRLLLGLLLLVQLGLFTHQLQHALAGDETHCALCVAADHLGHAPVSATVFAGITSVFLLLSVIRGTTPVSRRVLLSRGARAPPKFSSL